MTKKPATKIDRAALDPFQTARRMVERVTNSWSYAGPGLTNHERVAAELQALNAVVIVRALDRLTAAVRDNHQIVTVAGRVMADGGIAMDVD